MWSENSCLSRRLIVSTFLAPQEIVSSVLVPPLHSCTSVSSCWSWTVAATVSLCLHSISEICQPKWSGGGGFVYMDVYQQASHQPWAQCSELWVTGEKKSGILLICIDSGEFGAKERSNTRITCYKAVDFVNISQSIHPTTD
ncbi:hypothetical protein Dimus_032645 [Dionaea muscipula]